VSTPVPLGVRVFNNWGRSFDTWITNLVSDISFRSVIPGGYANATLTLHNDQSNGWTQVAQPFNRIQIVDLRSQEIAWEGRIDTVPRQTSDDTWELGCLGSMVYASDIQRPMFYIDSDIESWYPDGFSASLPSFRPNVLKDQNTLETVFAESTGWLDVFAKAWVFQRAEETDLFVGRFDATFSGGGSHASLSQLANAFSVTNGAGATPQTRIDVTSLTTAAVRKANPIGAAASFTSTTAQRVYITPGTASAVQIDVLREGQAISWVADPRVQVQRVDETGAKLQTAASYPQEYLTVEQIVRDVVGRFMVGAWHTAANNSPYHGFVGSEGIYIDTSATAQITHLTYYDGTTAAQILADLMTAQPNAYWALWESRYNATTDGNSDARFRFEWATWPLGWSYEATSIDGLEEQPDGGDLHNFLFYRYPAIPAWNADAGYKFLQTFWDTANENQLINDGQLVRSAVVQAEEPQSSATALTKARALHGEGKRTTNAGTLTVKRPIQAHDAGLNSNSGVSRMLDPWLIRPGKLIRITDIPPRSNSHTFAAGADAVIDTFGRTTANGWGSAESGQAWTNAGGAAADFSVSGGLGRHSIATNVSRWTTATAPGADFDLTATVATDVTPTGASHFVYLAGRWTGVNDNYIVRAEFLTTSAVALTIRKRVAGVETQLAGGTVASLTHAANRRFSVRFKASGSSLMAKVWLASADEPTAWTFTITDTDLTEIGSVGFRSILAGGNTNVLPVVATFDNFTAVGLTAYSPELDGTVFRVVGTTYSSADNSCVLELDQPPAWNTATQVITSARDAQPGGSKTLVRG
jgi:hypothetical protein